MPPRVPFRSEGGESYTIVSIGLAGEGRWRGSDKFCRSAGRALETRAVRCLPRRGSASPSAVTLVKKLDQQFGYFFRLLLLHPMSRAVHENTRPHPRAGAVLHALD